MDKEFKLYSYYRSSSAYRVRIALHLKEIDFEYIPVHLVKEGGEQHHETYKSLNPMCQVPCLAHKGQSLTQSMAIIQYLDEIQPKPLLFPEDAMKKAQVVEFCEVINSGIQPIQNLSVLQELVRRFKIDDEAKLAWGRLWIERGFQALENKLKSTADVFCFADKLTAADLFLVPQVYNANRFKIDMSQYPLIQKINDHCLSLEAFQRAEPSQQPDTP